MESLWSTDNDTYQCIGLTPSQRNNGKMSAVLPPEFADKNHIPLFFPAANLAANLVFDQVCSQVFDKFVRVCDMLSTRSRLFLSKTWSRTCCINLDMSRLMQQVRWFVRVLDKWNVEKPVSSQPTNLLKLDFRYVFYYSCLS